MDTMEQITVFVGENLLDGAGAVEADSPLFSSGLLDSFHLLELLLFIEDRFGVKITPQDIRPETHRHATPHGRPDPIQDRGGLREGMSDGQSG